MSKKYLLALFCILLAFAACRKDKQVPDERPDGQPTRVEIPPGQPAGITLSVANMLQSNMVIQRDKPFLLWGKATPGLTVNVAASWNASPLTTTADANGYWQISIPASAANGNPQTIAVSGNNATDVTLKNILIGDVWLCSGQSNMTMQVDAIPPFAGVLNYADEITTANYPNIRVLTAATDYQDKPLTEFTTPGAWTICSPQTVGKFSAVAYFFAMKLQVDLNIPVGIIVASENGSWCETWANTEVLTGAMAAYLGHGSSTLYNGMINPLLKLQLKGFIWYQGENNQHISPVSDYTLLNSALIKGWRDKFKQGDLPFYYVQLTPFAEDYNNTVPAGGDPNQNWLAFFREAQANIQSRVANTGMAVTMDVGEAANHHPRNKKPVGERLALLALRNTYGQNVICNGPKYSYFTLNGNTATINFAGNTADGLNTIDNQPLKQYFFVAGADRVFRKGAAVINGNTIVVTAPAETNLPIQAIRYAFTNAPVTNIQNGAGLPMEAFRTDSWDY
ncbi:sialate O-acetylesterase [Mucilaginibacter mali]|uniref:Sialate O-acetylesterase n=1 Tax=Mucilaginibacter mali TaxID=2740462 RepID=A0A7D4U9M2_9SPHI|nr:sialate O-acetylesterase [Mucilaginibacter mali]QKJ29178.1 sialate O-acetylesterase [Mucilaginibacter mali]